MQVNEIKTDDKSGCDLKNIAEGETPEIFRCTGLSKYYDKYLALKNVDFSVYSGEILGIIGPNGAGKTTLMECLAGLLPYDQGLTSRGKRPFAPHEAKQFIFYLPDGILPYRGQQVAILVDFFQRIFAASKTRSA